MLGYADLERKIHDTGIRNPSAQQIYDWVCAVRGVKLPDLRDQAARKRLKPGAQCEVGGGQSECHCAAV